MNPRHLKDMENGNSIRRDQEKLHLDVDSEDGWLEPAWRTEEIDCSFTKVVLQRSVQNIQDLYLLFLVRCQGTIRQAMWPR